MLFVVLAGATYQGVATALERRQFPHPGRLIDVGGHQLHIYCVGEGTPTVVLEAPAAGMSAAWGWVQPRIGEVTRVCSYDRAGLGWSEAGDRPYDPTAVAPSLSTLLEHAHERPPYVIAGQGLGAAFAVLDAQDLGDRVAAVALIDPPTAQPQPQSTERTMRLFRASPWLARGGLLRATRMLSKSAEGLPNPAAGALAAFLNRPDHLTRASRELSRWDATVAAAEQAHLAETIPIRRVIAAGSERVAFLTDPRSARVATNAILDMVATARHR